MLNRIGKGFSWLDGQTLAHLPVGWSILYQLAQLSRTAFEQLLQQGAIHPKLTLQQARELLANFKGRSDNSESRKRNVKARLRRFVEFVRLTFNGWQPEEQELAWRELTRLIAQIDPKDRVDFRRAFTNSEGHLYRRKPDRIT